MSILGRLLGRPRTERAPRPRQELGPEHQLIYAVGDIHGRLDLLVELERSIERESKRIGYPPTIILLGDMIDRGPKSAQILDHVLERRRHIPWYFCLAGNHEEAMIDFLQGHDRNAKWLEHGGRETLASYGMSADQMEATPSRRLVQAYIPDEHMEFLEALPISLQTSELFFSHAGARPGLPLREQSDADLLWFKDAMQSGYEDFDKLVVHGHDALNRAHIGNRRINVDTGAFATGRLSAVCLRVGHAPRVLTATL